MPAEATPMRSRPATCWYLPNLEGEVITPSKLKAADDALASAARMRAFHGDALASFKGSIAAAREAKEGENRAAAQYHGRMREEAVNAELRARLPSQPDDAELIGGLLCQPNWLSTLLNRCHSAYNKAYGHWRGNPQTPIMLNRAWLITDGQS